MTIPIGALFEGSKATTDLTAITGANMAVGDLLALVDISDTADSASGSDKKAALDDLIVFLQRNAGLPRVKRTAIHSISSTTGTEVTDLTIALEAGTYVFDYTLIVRSATTSVGPMVGVNFDGTAAVKTMIAYWGDASASLLAETHIMDDEGSKATGFISGMPTKTYSTTAPNMGTTVGVIATASDIPMFIHGVLIVTVAGNLELWHSSETATATSVEAGSSLVVVRTA
jgi:hypothetical protein